METDFEIQNLTEEVNIFSRPPTVKPIVSINTKRNEPRRPSMDLNINKTPSVIDVAEKPIIKKKVLKNKPLVGQKNNKSKIDNVKES